MGGYRNLREVLSPLSPEVPWFGYPLGLWGEENEEEAQMATRVEYYKIGERLTSRRVPSE